MEEYYKISDHAVRRVYGGEIIAATGGSFQGFVGEWAGETGVRNLVAEMNRLATMIADLQLRLAYSTAEERPAEPESKLPDHQASGECTEAPTPGDDLRAENERLRAELDRMRRKRDKWRRLVQAIKAYQREAIVRWNDLSEYDSGRRSQAQATLNIADPKHKRHDG